MKKFSDRLLKIKNAPVNNSTASTVFKTDTGKILPETDACTPGARSPAAAQHAAGAAFSRVRRHARKAENPFFSAKAKKNGFGSRPRAGAYGYAGAC